VNFVHLHCHSDASIADGLFTPKRWIEAYHTKGYKAAGLTDHGTMSNLLPFYQEAKNKGILPILGVEFYFTENPLDKTPKNRRSSHLILFAKNFEGWKNLCRLSQLSYQDGFYYRPRIGLEWLKKHRDGLICLSACQGGILSTEVWKQKRGDEGLGLLNQFKRMVEIFGSDFYVEFQPHQTLNQSEEGEFCSQKMINESLYTLRKEVGFQQIVTNDCHYILPEHADLQRKIKEMQWRGLSKNSSIASDSATFNKDRGCDSLWLKSGEDIYETFRNNHEYIEESFLKEGIERSLEIVDKCKNFEFPKNKRYLPSFDVSGSKKFSSSFEFFKALSRHSLKKLIDSGKLNAPKEVYIERFKKEFDVISKYRLHDYFLIVWDLILFSNRKGIYSGIGRGSAAGCLISYILGIVKIDPIEYDLIFERFLNENRCVSGELPDIDLDFESERRNEIKQYIYQKYGKDCVSEIGTYGRIRLKTSIIDFGKAFGVGTQQELLSITTKLDLEKDEAQDPRAAANSDPKLLKLFKENRNFYFAVKEINGSIKSQGVHPAGVLICSEKIGDITPLKTQVSSEDGTRMVTTQAEDKYLIAQGFMKMDILGLKEYDVIRFCIENAKPEGITKENYVAEIMGREKANPDKRIWKMFQTGKTECVFQFASEGMQELLKQIKPTRLDDLIAANALFRPGCLENGWHTQYCDRKHGREKVSYVHPDVREVLKTTYGVCVFQEQFMSIIHKIGGISLVESDVIRSALGKKDKEKLSKFKNRFIEGAKEKVSEVEATKLWDQLEKASSYSFNKSHSAAYSVLAYISQYFKVYHPTHFWAAQIDWDIRKNAIDEMLLNRRAALRMGVEFVLPDINKSKKEFVVEDDKVIFSLQSVKSVGEGCAEAIVAGQPYKDFYDFYKRVNKAKVKYNNMESLILSGTMDVFGDRRDLLHTLVDLSNAKKKAGPKKRKRNISDTELMMAFYKSIGFFEKSIKTVRDFSPMVITESELREYAPRDVVIVGGMVSDIRVIRTKNNEPMAFLTIEDSDELLDVTVFPENYLKHHENLKEGSIVEVQGVKSDFRAKQNAVEAHLIRFL